MKKIGKIIICAILIIGLTGCKGSEKMKGLHHVQINVRDYGTITLELDADTAPITVKNFIDLANDKFYDGLTFHRIISNFMIQGGAFLEDGSYKEAKTIKGEFSLNNVKNDIEHVRGVISMARADDMNSASSQFFIVQKDSPHLNGAYAAFGRVTSGIEIVDEIANNTIVSGSNGEVLEENRPVIESIVVLD